MFGLFKRTKIESWEIILMKNVISRLPEKYSNLLDQINDGLFRGVLLNASDIQGYVAFTFYSDLIKKYDDDKQIDFKLANIRVYDIISASFVQYDIYVSSGTVSGYSIKAGKKFKIDVNNIDVSNFRAVFVGLIDYKRISNIFDEEELKVVNPSDLYSVFVDNKEYFHVKDLSDGDFIAIDEMKSVYMITHDPLKVIHLDKTLINVINNLS